MIQVTTVAQAIEASKRGADVIIAQGGEAGGYGGNVSTPREHISARMLPDVIAKTHKAAKKSGRTFSAWIEIAAIEKLQRDGHL
jgi:NAD(P)H-dependent flavin oxidoreductase YrpB (nitropropane dioxygenase family)